MHKIILTLLISLASPALVLAELPGAAPAANLFKAPPQADLPIPSTAALIPPGVKALQVSVTIDATEFKTMALAGFEYGVWFTFLNDADEEVTPAGKPYKGTKSPGFGLGVSRKTAKPKTETKKVVVPPTATKLVATVTKYSSAGFAGRPTDYKATEISAVPVP